MHALLPDWLWHYQRRWLADDVLAGCVVAVLLVPQAMAYAALAGLPPQIGLYASIAPLIAYAAFGSSMVLAVGPVAVISLMVATTLAPIAEPGSPQYVAAAALLALLSGLMLVGFGMLRLGALARFLSHPVISGFITGAALVILIGQLRPLLGISADADRPLGLLLAILRQLDQLHGLTAAVGVGSVLLLSLAKLRLAGALRRLGMAASVAKVLTRLAPMAVVLLGAGVVLAAGWEHELQVVGKLPAGLPAPFLPAFDLSLWGQLLVPALLIALIGFMESASIARAWATRHRQHMDADKELRGLGAANLASAFSGALPVTGGFSRTTVNAEAGAHTPLAGVITAMLIALIAAFATGVFQTLPVTVLAALIIVAVAGLVDVRGIVETWRYDRSEGMTAAITALSVVALGIEAGIATGIVLSLAGLVWRASRPHIAVVGRVPGTQHFRNIQRHRVETRPRLLLIRVDENLFFGNADAVRDHVNAQLTLYPDLRHLVLVMSSVSLIDATALAMLAELKRDLSDAGICLHLAEVKGPVLDALTGTAFLQAFDGRVFLSTEDAFRTLSGE